MKQGNKMTTGNRIYWAIIVAIFILINIAAGFLKTKHLAKIRAAKKVSKTINRIQNDNSGWLFSYLRKIDPFVFEELILLTFRKYGFRIKRNKRYTHDGGIDGRVKKNGESFLVQAKRYSGNINIEHVKDFIKVCRYHKVRGYFIHTGKTGREIRELMKENPQIKIISGEKIYEFFIFNRKKDKNLFF